MHHPIYGCQSCPFEKLRWLVLPLRPNFILRFSPGNRGGEVLTCILHGVPVWGRLSGQMTGWLSQRVYLLWFNLLGQLWLLKEVNVMYKLFFRWMWWMFLVNCDCVNFVGNPYVASYCDYIWMSHTYVEHYVFCWYFASLVSFAHIFHNLYICYLNILCMTNCSPGIARGCIAS